MFRKIIYGSGGIRFAIHRCDPKTTFFHSSTNMNPSIKERRQHQRYTVLNSIMVNHDGVFQLIDMSEGGFCFKCPPYADALDNWIAEILTPIGDLKECEVEKRWSTIVENGEFHLPSYMKFGVKFGQLTKNQHDDLTKLIGSISDYPTDWEIDKGNVL